MGEEDRRFLVATVTAVGITVALIIWNLFTKPKGEEDRRFLVATVTAVGITVALIIWNLFTKPKVKQYKDSRPLGSIEMVGVIRNSKTEGQMSNAFHIVSKQPLSFVTVKKAVTLVAQSQPLMRACIRPKSGSKGNLWFIPMDKQEYDIQQKTSGDWMAEVEQQMSIQYKESLGPLWRLVFLPNAKFQKTEGEFLHESVIVLACHHSIVDGISLMRLFAQIMNTINKIQEGTDKPNIPSAMIYGPLEEVTDFRGFKEKLRWQVAQVCSSLLKLLPGWMIEDYIFSLYSGPNPFYEKYGIEMKKNPSLPMGTSILPLELSCKETKTLLLACRRNRATIQGAAMAAINVVMDKILLNGTPDSEVYLQTMIMANSRAFHVINLPDNAMGDYPYYILMPVKVIKEQQTSFWASAKTCSEAVHEQVSREACVKKVTKISFLANLVKIRFHNSHQPKDLNIGPMVNVFSNMGICEYINKEGASVKAVARHGAVAMNTRSMAPFSHYITTVDGRLCWTLVYSKRCVSQEMAESVGNCIISSLLQASSQQL